MSQIQTIVKIISKEEVSLGKNQFIQHSDTSTIEYIENGKHLQNYSYQYCLYVMISFSELSPNSISQKQFVDDHVSDWITKLLYGSSQSIVVAGSADSGIKYLMKGSNSTPGIVSSIEKRLASLSGDMKITAKMSYIRYCDGCNTCRQ